MEVQVHRSTVVAKGDPHAVPTEIPLTIFDRFASINHVSVLYGFAPPTPSNSAIIQGLLKVLTHFPTLTARIGETADRHLPCLLLGGPGGGALVVEATVASTLSDHLPLEPSPDFWLLHPSWEGAAQVFQVQLNRFHCDGLVIAITADHRLADAQAMSAFFIAWAQTVRVLPIDHLPSYNLSWIQPRCPPRIEFQHWGEEFISAEQDQVDFSIGQNVLEPEKIANILLHYSPEFITELKVRIPQKHTTFETLLGFLWRKITIVRELDGDEYTEVRVSVNGRPRLRPPVPSEFFRNLVLYAKPKMKVSELVDGGVALTARIVHETVTKLSDDYFRSFIDFGAIHEEEDLVPVYAHEGNVMLPNIEVDSWLGFRFQEVDFGGGGVLCGFLPSWIPVDGVVILIPSLRSDEGVDVVVTLLEEHAMKLKEISHSLD